MLVFFMGDEYRVSYTNISNGVIYQPCLTFSAL